LALTEPVAPPAPAKDHEELPEKLQNILPSKGNWKTTKKIYKLLLQNPQSSKDMATRLESKQDTIVRYLGAMVDVGLVEKMSTPGYYRLKDHNYEINLEGPIEKLPRVFFRDIPRIKPWAAYAIGSHEKLKNLSCFERFCYGDIVAKFKINPAQWKHPEDTERLYQLYKEQYRQEYAVQHVKALRQFLAVCLRIQLLKGSIDAKLSGLVKQPQMAKYRHIRFNDASEVDQVIDWLEGEECARLCKDNNLQQKQILAHFGYAFEGFGRPSMVLAIEIGRVSKYHNKAGDPTSGLHLSWSQLETKQNMYFPKEMHHPRLIQYCIDWLEKRRRLGYKYMFIDESNMEIKAGDSMKLEKYRKPYTIIYRALFNHLNRQEAIFQKKTLYMLRHLGINYWLDRLGIFRGLAVVQEMAWTNGDTLRKHYVVISPSDIAKEIGTVLYGS